MDEEEIRALIERAVAAVVQRAPARLSDRELEQRRSAAKVSAQRRRERTVNGPSKGNGQDKSDTYDRPVNGPLSAGEEEFLRLLDLDLEYASWDPTPTVSPKALAVELKRAPVRLFPSVVAATQLRADRLREARRLGHHTSEEWQAMLDVFGGTCLSCGASDADLTKDHVQSLAMGGSDGILNLQPLCGRCNSTKAHRLIDHRNAARPGWREAMAAALEAPPATPAPAEEKAASKVWLAYCAGYKLRYGTFPMRNAKVNSQLKAFSQRVPGDDGAAVVEHYLKSNEPFYLRTAHSVGILLKQAEKLWMEWKTGREGASPVTPPKPWWETWPGICAMGEELQVTTDENPTIYKNRVLKAAAAWGTLPAEAAAKLGLRRLADEG